MEDYSGVFILLMVLEGANKICKCSEVDIIVFPRAHWEKYIIDMRKQTLSPEPCRTGSYLVRVLNIASKNTSQTRQMPEKG
nr:hypothetical protein BN993_03194 [Virgibacillus halodenitrificans]